MKQVITRYTFDSSTKTITLTDYNESQSIDIRRLYLVTDVTTNKILYNFSDHTVASAVVSNGNVITLSTLQGGEADADALQIVYEASSTDPVYDVPFLPANAAQESGGNLETLVGAVNGNRMQTGGIYNATSPNLSSGERNDTQLDSYANTLVSMGTAFSQDTDAITNYTKALSYTAVSASGIVSAVPVAFYGYYVSTSSSGIITFNDSASATLTGTSTVLATSQAITANTSVFLPAPIAMVNGLYFTLASGSATVLVLTRELTAT